jgi:hypothetical protein
VEEKESPLDSIVTNLVPSKYTHRFLACVVVHLGFEIFKMATVDIVTMKGKNIIFDPIVMKFHRNDPGEWSSWKRWSFLKCQTINAHTGMYTPRIITAMFHYNQSKTVNFHGCHGNSGLVLQ